MSETDTGTKADNAFDGHADVDVIVLGVGTCGEDLSLRLLGAGLDVVGIEAALVGGECVYWACLPSKMMIRAANVLQEARRVGGKAGHAEVTPDWGLLARRVRTEVTGGWDDSVAVERFGGRGGRLVHGRGRLTGPRTVAVGDESFTARQVWRKKLDGKINTRSDQHFGADRPVARQSEYLDETDAQVFEKFGPEVASLSCGPSKKHPAFLPYEDLKGF